MFKRFEMELAGRTLMVDVNRVAKQANGAVLMHYGDTTVLCTATASEKPRDGIDFFPLSVEYNERLYAVGKIPGGFNKREGKENFLVSVIPHTKEQTVLKERKIGDLVNLETDVLGKYVEKLLPQIYGQQTESRVTKEFLLQHGF